MVNDTKSILKTLIKVDTYPLLYQALCNAPSYEIEEGGFLFRQGDIPTKLAVTISGQLEVSYIDEDGNYVIIERCDEGFWFGDAAFIDGNPLPYSTQALSHLKIVSINHSEITKNIELENEVYRFVSHSVVARLRIMYGKFDNMATLPLSERLIDRLKQLSSSKDIVSVSHDDLASYLGISRHKVSRAMKELDNQGVIKQGYKKVEIFR
ncbi:Crp/Fnr family transcriptional regulator [Vibrio splendidus]|uniref:Crp/Fnr family transcriptional regulator n=1 Tax=Vibrio splendidus TaxID=29497 RepID=UPI00148E332C|nr:Crp/Fnr family transcriptional regulator [Vibrio splendidus]NOI91528.1 Crp/Fnr family transcriptional regulator [Vibrio splendidus]